MGRSPHGDNSRTTVSSGAVGTVLSSRTGPTLGTAQPVVICATCSFSARPL